MGSKASFRELVKEMVEEDLKIAEKDALVRSMATRSLTSTKIDAEIRNYGERTAGYSLRAIVDWLVRQSAGNLERQGYTNLIFVPIPSSI